jgi:hypothetical protein
MIIHNTRISVAGSTGALATPAVLAVGGFIIIKVESRQGLKGQCTPLTFGVPCYGATSRIVCWGASSLGGSLFGTNSAFGGDKEAIEGSPIKPVRTDTTR